MSQSRVEAIAAFLRAKTVKDLADLYNPDMEVQVNVAQDGGERIDKEYKSKKTHAWTDGVQTWKSFRIPYNAATKPEYRSTRMDFDLAAHADAIGMTGWDWKALCSRWVAFDFDSIVGHKKGLTDVELRQLLEATTKVPYVTLRTSTSGSGYHIYIFLDPVIQTANHTEHAALGRAILGQLSVDTGIDLQAKVDACGGNMWVWARKAYDSAGLFRGLKLIKAGEPLTKVPINWRDHVSVIKGHTRKAKIPGTEKCENELEVLYGQNQRIPLDEVHKKLLGFLSDTNAMWWWDADHHMLITHTVHLKEAHSALMMRGPFETISTGKEKGQDQNCFAYPMPNGAWNVRRYTLGVQEHPYWTQDGQGWTRCYLNREPSFQLAARAASGVEHPKGGFVFQTAEFAKQALETLGATNLDIPLWALPRKAELKEHKDGRIIFRFMADSSYGEVPPGWLYEKGWWSKIISIKVAPPESNEVGNFDDFVRHIVTPTGDDCGWLIKTGGRWNTEPLVHIKHALDSSGYDAQQVKDVIGQGVLKCWELVHLPFKEEYPGDRKWNKNSPQLRFAPAQEDDLEFPTWLKILAHVGKSLDKVLQTHPWATVNQIKYGSDYLMLWIASIFQEPFQPLPYLFLYGPQNSGKSILHEAITRLVTSGVVRADHALTSQHGHNAELAGAVLCVIEETNLSANKVAYNRLKDWVTSRKLSIHEKYMTPYTTDNSTHWIQCANEHNAVPIAQGDTRIVVLPVDPIDPTEIIPKKDIEDLLDAEAPAFLAHILSLDIPPSNDRLNVPVVATEDKLSLEQLNQPSLLRYINDNCYYTPGEILFFDDFYDTFVEQLTYAERQAWNKQRLIRDLPIQYAAGRSMEHKGRMLITNISMVKHTEIDERQKLLVVDGWVRRSEELANAQDRAR